MESKQKAADGTTYDNGYGICMIPYSQPMPASWNQTNTLTGAYKSSYMHTTVLPNYVTTKLQVLGSHIVKRNVLLSSSINSTDKFSNAYTWTTAYATLMSVGQMTGNFAANKNKYDDGEANYKLPIFDHADFKTGSDFWTRNVSGDPFNSNTYCSYYIHYGGDIMNGLVTSQYGVRPLIYLR